MSTLAEVILRDTRANQPAAGSTPAGTLYYVTDESVMERCTGSAWEDVSAAGSGGMTNPMTTAGDIIYSSDGSGTPARLGVGSNGEVLTLASGVPSWAAASGGSFVVPVSPGQVTYAKASGDYSTSSDTFVDVDGTNLTITKTFTGARPARITVSCTSRVSVSSAAIGFDIDIDGTRLLNTTYGMVFNYGGTANYPTSFTLISSALTAASHTFKLQWRKVGAATATIAGASGVYPVNFTVEELPS